MRVYLVIVDDSEEALVAMQYAARRAARTDGALHLLAIVPPQEFNAFAGVQATIEEEARARAETLVTAAAGNLLSQGAKMPLISVRVGEDIKVVGKYLEEHPEVSALVLGAARESGPGPLVVHFTGSYMAKMACPVFVIPGGLDDKAIEKLAD
ncbi:universal stress protein [Novosphingobium sp. YJ-S2-02]|uniref:Universal stress protein n=1 Tax=Novosphingobium aureum TaxID=2792964 RepID=A0A931HCY5_9SPHN|nr:universal stress protein [Novosphingobium aureum]MBH0113173.1 universal stress protein [Novosphingobium aureum]